MDSLRLFSLAITESLGMGFLQEKVGLDMVANVGTPKIMIPVFVCLLRNAWWSIAAFWKRPKEVNAGK